MTYIRRLILALALSAGLAPAFAQVAPPVPALPDTERRTTYSISASTCACNVNFALYGDSTDYANWIEVFVNGVRMAQAGNWTLSSATGTIGSIPLPITNAVLTFTAPQTGTIQIVGARRPRRTSQFNEGSGVPTRNFNVVLSDLTAQNRELWDKTNDVTGRALISQPGNTVGLLPLPSVCAGKFLGFDGTGLIPTCTSGGAGTGNVVGPASSTVGHVAIFNNTTGTLLSDAGGGVDQNILNARTSAYAAVATDCGNTITLGGNAFYSLTISATTNFSSTCSIVIINTDSGRGKLMAVNGVTFPNNSILWPNQSFTLKSVNSVWTVIGLPPMWKPTTTVTFNINTVSGVDNPNDCLGTGTGACATLTNAAALFCQNVFVDNVQINFQTLTGQTHPGQTLCNYVEANQTPANPPQIIGDISSCANAANYVIDGAASPGVAPVRIDRPWTIKGMKITSSTNGTAVVADQKSHLYLGTNTVFSTVTGFHIRSFYQSFVEIIGNYCITGGAAVHASSNSGGQILIQPGLTVTCSNAPAFSSFFAQSVLNGFQEWASTTFSGCGTVTGPRYSTTTGGGIDTNGGGASFLPGNSIGSTNNPGWYN